jgi:hypothetical protein
VVWPMFLPKAWIGVERSFDMPRKFWLCALCL